MIKIYTLKRLRACRLTCSDGSVQITLNFEPTYGTQRSANGKVVISDPNVQSVIESDPKFGKVYVLTAAYEDKEVETIQNVNGEKQVVVHATGRKRRTQAQIDAENAEKQSDDKPKKTVGKQGKKVNESRVEEEEQSFKKENMVFSDVNEAFAYFAAKGEHCTSQEELVELMDKYGASFSEE